MTNATATATLITPTADERIGRPRSRRRLMVLAVTLMVGALPLASCAHPHVIGYGSTYDQGTGD